MIQGLERFQRGGYKDTGYYKGLSRAMSFCRVRKRKGPYKCLQGMYMAWAVYLNRAVLSCGHTNVCIVIRLKDP